MHSQLRHLDLHVAERLPVDGVDGPSRGFRLRIGNRGAQAGLLQHTGLVATKRNVHEELDKIEQLWSPHVVGEVNDYDVKVANVAGEFAEHVHDDTDEVFLVLAGRLHLDLPDVTVTLDPLDLYTVPRGVRHRPRADAGTRILMLEPRGTSQDGTPAGTTGVRLT